MELGEGEDDGDDMICMPLSFASMQSYHSPEALLADSAPEFDDDLSAEDFVRQVEKKIDEAGLDLNLSLDAWDDDNMTFQNPLEVVEEYDIEKYAAVNPDDLMEHLSLTEEQCTMFKLGKEIQRNNQQLKELVAQHSVYHATAVTLSRALMPPPATGLSLCPPPHGPTFGSTRHILTPMKKRKLYAARRVSLTNCFG